MSILFRRTATVYGRGAGGTYTTVLTAGLRCNLLHISLRAAPTGPDRAELAARRRFVWDASFVLPAFAQIEIDGLRWNPVSANAIETMSSPDGTPAYKRVDVSRAA